MFDSLRHLVAKHLYHKETNFILNNLTLRISDKEIEAEYQKKRTKRFNSLFWP